MSKEGVIKNSELLDLSDAKLSDITEEKDALENELNNISELYKIERNPKVYLSNEQYEFNGNERLDVYIKNYLNKFEMNRTLKAFEQEFYELLSKEKISIDEIPKVPEVYIESEKIQEEIGNIQKELDDAKIYAEKAKSLFIKLNNQKESEKIKHRRVQQEKKKLIKEIEKIKHVYTEDSKIYKDLKKKYWEVTNESLLLENEQTKYKASYNALKEQSDKIKKTLDEAKKQRESKKHKYKYFSTIFKI
jgi:hypothetical protein